MTHDTKKGPLENFFSSVLANIVLTIFKIYFAVLSLLFSILFLLSYLKWEVLFFRLSFL